MAITKETPLEDSELEFETRRRRRSPAATAATRERRATGTTRGPTPASPSPRCNAPNAARPPRPPRATTAPSAPFAMSNSNGSTPLPRHRRTSAAKASASRNGWRKSRRLPDSDAREMLEECLGSVLSFYGHGLERILRILEEHGTGGRKNPRRAASRCGRDRPAAHPRPASRPARKAAEHALEKVRPYMQSHGGDVELISLEDDHARAAPGGPLQDVPVVHRHARTGRAHGDRGSLPRPRRLRGRRAFRKTARR